MAKMTLHEAIIKVIKDRGMPIGVTEIAEIINREKLYERADGKPMKAPQVSARVNNYPSLFRRRNGKICLLHEDE